MKKFQASSFKFQDQGGFTLIELIVVLALFVFIIDATVTIFVSVVHHQKMILGQQELLNQANYVLETMSQGIRQAGADFTGTCLGRGKNVYELTHPNKEAGFFQGIRFIGSDGVCQEFFLDSDGVFKRSQNGEPAQAVISDKFSIKYARFMINGNKNVSTAESGALPRITVALDIQTQTDGQVQDQILQTTISQRNYK